MYRIIRIFAIALCGALASISIAHPAHAAAPHILVVYGSPLAKPIIISDWNENLSFMLSISDETSITSEELSQRPYLKLAFFWGLEWENYVDEGKPLDALTPEQANQSGRFYPAIGNAPPVVTFDSIPDPGALKRTITAEGLAILSRHGVPVRVQPNVLPQTGARNEGLPVTLSFSVVLLAGVGLLLALVSLKAWQWQRSKSI